MTTTEPTLSTLTYLDPAGTVHLWHPANDDYTLCGLHDAGDWLIGHVDDADDADCWDCKTVLHFALAKLEPIADLTADEVRHTASAYALLHYWKQQEAKDPDVTP